MPRASILVGLIALVAAPCFAQAPSASPVNLAAVLGFSGDALPQNGLLFLTAECTNGAIRRTPTGNCCNLDYVNTEMEKDRCVDGMWQFDSIVCWPPRCGPF